VLAWLDVLLPVSGSPLRESFFCTRRLRFLSFAVFGAVISNLLFSVLSTSFERTYDKLMSVERTFEAQGAKKILDCIRSDQNNELLVHNYYNNKFDATGTSGTVTYCFALLRFDVCAMNLCLRFALDPVRACTLPHLHCACYLTVPFFLSSISTAWNDFDAIPRSASKFGLTDHGGSRKRLLFSRREVQREEVATFMTTTTKGKQQFPSLNFRRVNMITDPAVENS
jgi:hypothetical protein